MNRETLSKRAGGLLASRRGRSFQDFTQPGLPSCVIDQRGLPCLQDVSVKQRVERFGVLAVDAVIVDHEVGEERLIEQPAKFWTYGSALGRSKRTPTGHSFRSAVRALQDGTLLYMAVPRMASLQPFFLLDPQTLELPVEQAAEKKEAAQVARRVGVEDMRPIDVVICGSVAVNRSGARIGKGTGYSHLEVALLIEAGLVTDETVIVAPVHQLQVTDEEIPEAEHDFSVDLIITPDEVIQCPTRRRPRGLVWNDLTAEKIAAIPVLAAQVKDRSAE